MHGMIRVRLSRPVPLCLVVAGVFLAWRSVVAQDPPGQSRAPQVSLLVNRGEEATTYVMPDVIGTDAERATTLLRSRGFRVATVGSQPYPGVPAGTVVKQTPAGGFRVGSGDPISLEVSR